MEESNKVNDEMQNCEEKIITTEPKDDDSIWSSNKDESKSLTEYSDQMLDIKSALNHCILIKQILEKYDDQKVYDILKQIERIDLVQLLNGKENRFVPQRLLNAKDIIVEIEEWIHNLHCCIKDCTNNATIMYQNEDSDNFYCNDHAKEDFVKPINLEKEFIKCKSLLRELEKTLLFVQVQMMLINNEITEDGLYKIDVDKIKKKFNKLK